MKLFLLVMPVLLLVWLGYSIYCFYTTRYTAKPRTKTFHKRLITAAITTVSVVFVLGGLYWFADHLYRQQFSKVYNEVEQIRTTVIEPLGGVEWTEGTYSAKLDGKDLLSLLGCVDVNCPGVTRQWLVAIPPDGNDAFVKNLMQTTGYTQEDGYEGAKGKLHLGVAINSADYIRTQPMPKQPAGTEIKQVQTSVVVY